ncbi:hypothetical protein [Burkholderia multivorans]|uniref:hypothetical protein n=1 Tax=Burkholderiaceae TaxID=119060 RepID=UPI001269AD98|nr:hypothetical protein [Burkholderia multivorans]HDR9473297.1 hypothetical protein [Burkholderia multivorans]
MNNDLEAMWKPAVRDSELSFSLCLGEADGLVQKRNTFDALTLCGSAPSIHEGLVRGGYPVRVQRASIAARFGDERAPCE